MVIYHGEAKQAKKGAKEAAETGGSDAEDQEDGVGTKSDWAEAIDEESGDPYYYNIKTGETTWDKPEGFGETEAANDSDQQGENATDENEDENKEYPTISESEARAYFDGFDIDGEGIIGEEDFDALVDIIAENRPDVCIPQTRAEVLAALEMMDPDAKGKVQVDAYLDWIEAYTSSGGESHGEVTGGAIILRGDVETAWVDSRDGARQGQAIRELKRLDPGWDLLDWFEEVQDEIVPAVVHGYLEGDNELIDYYCFEQAYCFISCWSIKDILSFNCVNFISIYFIFYCTNLLVSFFFVSLGLVNPRDFCRAL